MKFLLVASLVVAVALAAPSAKKPKRDILPGDARFGTEYHLNHHHVHENEIDTKSAHNAEFSQYGAPNHHHHQQSAPAQVQTTYGAPTAVQSTYGAPAQNLKFESTGNANIQEINHGLFSEDSFQQKNVQQPINSYGLPASGFKANIEVNQQTVLPKVNPAPQFTSVQQPESVQQFSQYGAPAVQAQQKVHEFTSPAIQTTHVHQPAQIHVQQPAQIQLQKTEIVKTAPVPQGVTHTHIDTSAKTVQPSFNVQSFDNLGYSGDLFSGSLSNGFGFSGLQQQYGVPQTSTYTQTSFPSFSSGNFENAFSGHSQLSPSFSGFSQGIEKFQPQLHQSFQAPAQQFSVPNFAQQFPIKQDFSFQLPQAQIQEHIPLKQEINFQAPEISQQQIQIPQQPIHFNQQVESVNIEPARFTSPAPIQYHQQQVSSDGGYIY